MKSILMIEDEAMLTELFGEYVQMLGEFTYLGFCDNGALALERCLKERPDIVIQDIRLPEVSGLELLRDIRRNLPDTKVLVFSGSLDAHSVKTALDGDAHGFVEKAYGLAELNKAILEVAAGRRYYSKGAQDFVTRLQSGTVDV
ncbi:MAG TPA: response regulator transcription factor [Opitutales bacterium]|nr:response regulator transcription factor [Opitutales bacterium]